MFKNFFLEILLIKVMSVTCKKPNILSFSLLTQNSFCWWIYFGNNFGPNLIQIFIFLTDVKPVVAGIKIENVVVKTEVKTEVKSESPIRVHPVTGLPTKDDEYDSSATVSH